MGTIMNYKKIIYIFFAACVMLIASCSEDLGYTSEYNIKDYYNGSDPRTNLLAFRKSVQTLRLPFVGDVCLEEKTEVFLDMRSTREVVANEKLTFEVVSKNDPQVATHKEKVFVAANRVTFDESFLTWPAGKDTHTSKMSVSIAGVPSGAILPIKMNIGGSSQFRASENYSLQIVQIESQQVVSLSQQIFELGAAITSDGVRVEGDGQVTVSVSASQPLSGYRAKLIRDEQIMKDYPSRLKGYEVAPDNMFPAFEEQSFDDKQNITFSFQVANTNAIQSNKKIVLPLRLVLLNKDGKQIDLQKNKGDVLVQIEFYEAAVVATQNEAELGTPIMPKSEWTIDTNPVSQNIARLTDGDERGSSWYGRVLDNGTSNLIVDLKESKSISGFKFSNLPNNYYSEPSPSSYRFFISRNGSDWEAISGILSGDARTGAYLFKTLKACNTRYVMFRLTAVDDYVGLTEITIYRQ